MKIKKIYSLFFLVFFSTLCLNAFDDEFKDENYLSQESTRNPTKNLVKLDPPIATTIIFDDVREERDNQFVDGEIVGRTGPEIARAIIAECNKLKSKEEKEDLIIDTLCKNSLLVLGNIEVDSKNKPDNGIALLADTIKADNSAQAVADAKTKIQLLIEAQRNVLLLERDIHEGRIDSKYLYAKDPKAKPYYRDAWSREAGFFEKLGARISNFKAFISKVTRKVMGALSAEECLNLARAAKTPQQLERWFTKATEKSNNIKGPQTKAVNITDADLQVIVNKMMSDALSAAQRYDDFTLLNSFKDTNLPLTATDKRRMDELIQKKYGTSSQGSIENPHTGGRQVPKERPGQESPREDHLPKEKTHAIK